MKKKKISVNKTVIINIFSLVLIQGISFITAPIFLRLLGADQYGSFALFSSRVSILSCVFGLGAAGGLATSHYDFPDQYFEFRSSNILLGTVLSLCIIILSCIFIKPLSILFNFSYFLTFLIFLTSYSIFVCNFATSAFVYEKKPLRNFFSSLSLSVMNIIMTFIFIWFLNKDERYIARIFGYAFSHIIVAIVLWIIIFLKKPTGLNRKYNSYALRIGFPYIFHALSNTVLIQSDRLMMDHMDISNSEIGIYTAFYSLASLLTSILAALNTSWTPFYYDDLKEKRFDALKIKINRYLELFAVITCGFILLSREVAIIYAGKHYMSGLGVLPVLILASFFIFLYQFPVNFELYLKKTKTIAIGTIGAALINILLNFIGIRIWGMYGAAIATVVSYFFLFLAHYKIAKSLKEMVFHIKLFQFIPWFLMVVFSIAFFYILSDYWYIRWGLGLLIGIIEIIRIYKRKCLF